jgi:hypothetical protein
MHDRPGLRSVVVDCHHPLALARFWAEALGWTLRPHDQDDLAWLAERGLTPETDPSIAVDPPDPSLPNLWFNEVPEPKVGKVRIHMDVNVPDARGIDRLVELGARVLAPHPGGEGWTVMADPEGNEFCVFPLDEQA